MVLARRGRTGGPPPAIPNDDRRGIVGAPQEYHSAAIPRPAAPRRHAGELREKLADVGRVVDDRPSVARGVDARPAAEGVDLEAGIVRDGREGGGCVRMGGHQEGYSRPASRMSGGRRPTSTSS